MRLIIIIKKMFCLILIVSLVAGLIPEFSTSAKQKLRLSKASISLVGGDVGGFKLKVKGLSKNQKVKFTTSNIKVAWFNVKKSNQKKGYVYVVGDKPGNAVVTAKIGKTKLTCKIKVTSPVKGAKMIIPSQLRSVGSDYGGRFSVSNAKFHWTHLGYELRFKVAMLSEDSNIPNYIYKERNTFSTDVAFLDKNDKVLNAVSNYNIGFLGTSGHASLSSEEYDRSGEVFSGVGDTKEYCVPIFHGVLGKVKKVVFLANPFDPCDYTGLKLPDKAYEDITVVSPTPTPTPTGKQLTKLYYENSSYTWNHDAIPRTVWQPTECDGNGIHPFAIMYSSADGSRFTYGDYTYKSSNTSVATIDGNGAVTFVGYGTTILTCSYGTLSSSMTLTITGGGVGTPTPTPYVTPTPTPDAHTHCNHCNGAGSFLCERCGGTGLENCKQCNNTGKITLNSGTVVMCPNCKGVKKNCWDCNGAKRINCKYCRGTGIYNSVCYNCFGTGIATCSRCGGGGVVPCFSCYGTGKNNNTGERCRVCAGSGRLPCDVCDGKCKVWCPECNGTGKQ